MNTPTRVWHAAFLAVALCSSHAAWASVSAEEAAQLKTTLTPLGAEKAANKDGSIPAWTGGLTTPAPGFKNGGRRPDPFASDKPLYSVTAKNMDQYTDRLSDGVKAMLKKYPDTFRLDVYPTRRTAAAPQWIYDNTFKNATRASLVDGPGGPTPRDAFGGIPFPIPKSGAEAIINHKVRVKPYAYSVEVQSYLNPGDGKWLRVLESGYTTVFPYYDKDAPVEKFDGDFFYVRNTNSGPPIRAGEAILTRANLSEDKTLTWVYLTGQRRVRKLPNACCDTPTPFSAGVVSFDEIAVFNGRIDRFDWKLVGKKELLIPYNSNGFNVPAKDAEVLGSNHLNPDHVRWELHRVWVVDASLRAGQRHPLPKGRYYLDEDTWMASLGERYDANGTLARVPFALQMSFPDVPVVTDIVWGSYDLIGGSSYVSSLINESKSQVKILDQAPPQTYFSPDAMAADNAR